MSKASGSDPPGITLVTVRVAASIIAMPSFDLSTFSLAQSSSDMLGGHLGFRYFYEKQHWTINSEVRMFACHNFQYLTRYQDQVVTSYGTPGGTTVDYELRNKARAFDRSDEFVCGGEVRVDATYALTRDIGFNFGLTVLDLADGIGRGNDIRDNTEGVMMAGVNFGFWINR